MSHFEDRHLDFVLKHYKEGAFDTGKAIGRFNDAHGIRPASGRRLRFIPMGIAAAAVMLLGVFLFFGHESRQWTEITASAMQHYAFIWIPVGLLICMTVIAFNFVGDGLRDAYDPKAKR